MGDSQERREGPAGAGALEELARDPASRKRFLKAVGAGGAGAFSLLLAACGSKSKSSKTPASNQPAAQPSRQNDIKILNFALTLEHIEVAFYAKVAASGLFSGGQLDLLTRFGAEEKEHVDSLTAAVGKLGGSPTVRPATRFTLGSASDTARLAATVENLGAAAYLGQVAAIQSKEVLATALSIHTVEARHAAALNRLTGQSPTPDGAFGKPASQQEVLAQVRQYIVS